MRLKPLLLVACLAGCAEPPILPGAVTQTNYDAPYPTLVPLAPILAQANASSGADPAATLEARAAALSARAAALRNPVIDAETSALLQPSPALQ